MRRALMICPLLLATATLLAPTRADACGGTFCDGGAQLPMPVDQTGEDILFIRDAGELEIHVRIEYDGEAERFAWLLPLPALPEVSIGSDPLFFALGNATIPVWSTITSFEDPPNNGCPPSGCLDLEDGDPPPPNVVYEEIIGAYEVVILETDTAAAVLDFFDQNNYAYDPAAAPLIQSYLDEGSLITAVKLTAGASVDEIHPLVFRLASDEPCVPIRLTAVAAKQDMSVRAYFLGQGRWAPSNYAHVVLNPLAYDWSTQSFFDYIELLSLAIDEAGGHAFTTEYAGTSEVVATTGVWSEDWDADSLAGMDAHMVLDALVDMQLILGGQITPHVLAALREFIPVPQNWGAPELDFWLDHARHGALIDMIVFDAVGFAARLDERVFEPGMHAADLLDAWPYLTRLHATISPIEMTLDPTFHEAPDLPGVRERRTATALVHGDGDWATYDVPFASGSEAATQRVCIETDAGWPDIGELPMALRIEQIPSMGPPQVMVDNQARVEQWAHDNYAGSGCEAADGEDTSDGGVDSEGSGDAGESESGSPGAASMGSPCACSGTGGAGGGIGAGLLLVLGGALRRRRR
jgi:MYXO-CTERM domain-containing protein